MCVCVCVCDDNREFSFEHLWFNIIKEIFKYRISSIAINKLIIGLKKKETVTTDYLEGR